MLLSIYLVYKKLLVEEQATKNLDTIHRIMQKA